MAETPNILHVVDEPYDSGIVHYALSAAGALKGRGWGVHFAGRSKCRPVEQAGLAGLRTIALPAFPASVAALRRYIQENKIGLINVHTGASHTLAVLSTRGLSPEIPVIRTRGDSRPVRRTATSSLLWRRTAGFIAATHRILDDFRGANAHLRMPMTAILPGLPDPESPRRPDPLPQGSAEVSDSPLSLPGEGGARTWRIGIVARLDPVKGHIHFLRAAQRILKEIPTARFLIAGREENVKTAQLKSSASDLGIEPNVEFLGHVPDVFEFMRGCDLGVIASIGSEAISRVAIEWMAVGRPVVSTSVGSLPELVSEGETGLIVQPEDADLTAKCVVRLIQDAELARTFGRQARKRYETHFSMKRFADDTEKFYEETLFHLSPR